MLRHSVFSGKGQWHDQAALLLLVSSAHLASVPHGNHKCREVANRFRLTLD